MEQHHKMKAHDNHQKVYSGIPYMETLTIQNIIKACAGTYNGSASLLDRPVSAVTIDSRKITKDSLFIALKGQRVDGHSFIPQVMEQGALCALSEIDMPDADFPYIRVGSTHRALKDIASFYRRSLPIRVVGISGSVGKTSTKEMIASILSQKYNVLKTEGNYNNEIGLPLTVLRLRKEHEIAVLEMGISDFGEMTRLADIAKPDIAVLTNIGYAHMETLGSRDGILQAKTEMLSRMDDGALVVLNGGDDKLGSFTVPDRLRSVYFYSEKPEQSVSTPRAACGASFTASFIRSDGLGGTEASFTTPNGSFTAHIPIPGIHMLDNALAGIAVGMSLSLSIREIKNGIESLRALAGRNHIVRANGYTVIDDCYNANPASMKASLDVLSQAPDRRVAILGDMFELGENAQTLHDELGLHAVQARAQLIICIGSLSEHTAAGAKRAAMQAAEQTTKQTTEQAADSTSQEVHIRHFPDNESFLKEARSLLRKGDTILVKASHGMRFQELVESLTAPT